MTKVNFGKYVKLVIQEVEIKSEREAALVKEREAAKMKKLLHSEKCTIGGQRWRGGRLQTWNLPESSF